MALRDVPLDVTAVSRQVLDDRGIIDLKDAVNNVSGVYPSQDRGDNTTLFNIRGFRQDEVYRDGLRDVGNYNVTETADLESVEVLKGPASILYGQVSPGGLIDVVTKKPESTRFTTIGVQSGSFGLVRPSVDTTGSLNRSGTLLYRVNTVYEHSDSFRKYSFTDRDFVAPSLSYAYHDKTHLFLDFNYLKNHSAFDFGVPGFGTRPYPVPISFTSGGPNTRVDEKQFRGMLRLVQEFTPKVSLHAYFSGLATSNVEAFFLHGGIEPDGVTLDRYANRFPYNFKTYNVRTDLHASFSTGHVTHTFLAGGAYFNRQAPTYEYDFDPTNLPLNLKNPVYTPLPAVPVEDIGTYAPFYEISGGPYIQDLMSITSRLKLLAGIRYTDYVEKEHGATPADDTFVKAHAFSPQIGVIYRLSSPISLYGNWTRSFTPVSGTTSAGKTFQPEVGQQFEAGVKSELFQQHLTGTLGVYHIVLDNVLAPDPANPLFNISAGKQRSQGVELDVTGKITPQWNVLFNYALLQANVIGTSEGSSIPTGTPLANDSRHGANLFTSYEVPRGLLRNLTVGGGLFGHSYQYEGLGDPVILPGFAKLDLNASYGIMMHDRLRYKLQVNVVNVSDRHYYEIGTSSGSLPGSPRAVSGSLRMFF